MSDNIKKLNCDTCDKQFSSNSSLKRHVRSVHEKALKCKICSKSMTSLKFLKYHMRLHGIDSDIKESFKCPICSNYLREEDISHHFQKEHEILLKSYNKEFINFNEFYKWKQEFEGTEKSCYVKFRSSSKRVDGSLLHEYFCHRSGYYRTHGTGKRRLKKQGSNKMNSNCPSKIIVLEARDGTVTAFITETHAGHVNDTEHLRKRNEEHINNTVFNELISDNKNFTMEERKEMMRQRFERLYENVVNEDQLNYFEEAVLSVEKELLSMKSKSLQGSISNFTHNSGERKREQQKQIISPTKKTTMKKAVTGDEENLTGSVSSQEVFLMPAPVLYSLQPLT